MRKLCQILSDIIRYCQILSDTVRYCQILSDIVRYCQILSDTVRYCQILSDIVRYCQILSDIVRYCQILSDIVRYCQILSDTVRYCPLFYSCAYLILLSVRQQRPQLCITAQQIMKLKGYKEIMHGLVYYSPLNLSGPTEVNHKKKLQKDSQCSCRYSNCGSPEYKSEYLLLQQSALFVHCLMYICIYARPSWHEPHWMST